MLKSIQEHADSLYPVICATFMNVTLYIHCQLDQICPDGLHWGPVALRILLTLGQCTCSSYTRSMNNKAAQNK